MSDAWLHRYRSWSLLKDLVLGPRTGYSSIYCAEWWLRRGCGGDCVDTGRGVNSIRMAVYSVYISKHGTLLVILAHSWRWKITYVDNISVTQVTTTQSTSQLVSIVSQHMVTYMVPEELSRTRYGFEPELCTHGVIKQHPLLTRFTQATQPPHLDRHVCIHWNSTSGVSGEYQNNTSIAYQHHVDPAYLKDRHRFFQKPMNYS